MYFNYINTERTNGVTYYYPPPLVTSKINPAMEVITTIKSNLFQLSRQYSKKPKPITYITSKRD